MGNKEFGGVVLAFAGFVFLVGAVKGTWRNAWAALSGAQVATGTTTSANGPGSLGVHQGGKGSVGNGSSNLPGSAPAPFSR